MTHAAMAIVPLMRSNQRRRVWWALAFVVAACGGADATPVSPDENLARRIEALVTPYVDPSGRPGKAIGIVVGVSSPKFRSIAGFGATTLGGAVRPQADTIFEIGSVTKVFTGYLLARAIDSGEITLDQTIDAFFPLGAPQFNGRSIAMLDLATHTAGLPVLPGNVHSSDPLNPAAGYTALDLARFMTVYPLRVEPGTRFLYSNLGAGTLGHLLTRTAKLAGYEALVRRNVADLMGLNDTRIDLSAEQNFRRAQGYRNGLPAQANQIGEPLAGAGALRSSGQDLLAFVDSALGKGAANLASPWQRVLTARRPSPMGLNGNTGFLINIEDHNGHSMFSKDGQTAGFRAQIVFTTNPPMAVVLLANTSDVAGLRELGIAILDELLARL